MDWVIDGFGGYVAELVTRNDLQQSKEVVKKFESIRYMVALLYRALEIRGDIDKLEILPKEEKLRLWKESEGLGVEKERLQYCRAAYLIEVILKT